MWNPQQYGLFADERSRPFFDLLARLADLQPASIVDLGCGDGALTRVLGERWPEANVLGIDSSVEMLAKAQASPPRLRFERQDIAAWQSDRPVDLVFSNAALHWVPEHRALLPRLAHAVAPGGALALQVPDNFRAPSHRVVEEVAAMPQFRDALAGRQERAAVLPLADYAELLLGIGFVVDAWATEYLHVLPGDDAVLQWLLGTTLRPHLAALGDTPLRQQFLRELATRLSARYPRGAHGTPFAFRRLFVVARRT